MIRGTKRPVSKPPMELSLRASIHNRFDVEVIDAATGELKQKARGFNVICEGLWDTLLNGERSGHWVSNNYFNNILFGKGSGTPAASDTTLFSQLGYKAVGYNDLAYSWNRRTGVASAQAIATLQAEEYVGETLTEVGIGYDTTHCATHALLQDMNGNPISILKTDTDVIKIYATVFVHWPADGWYGGSVNLSAGVARNSMYNFMTVLLGKASVGVESFYLQSAKQAPWYYYDDTLLNLGVYPSVSRSNKTLTAQFRLAAATANGPVMYISFADGHASGPATGPQYGVLNIFAGSWFSPPTITGEAVGTGDGSATGFATAFPVRSGATVYVDGAAASGVTVRGGPADATRMDQWFGVLAGATAAAGALTANGTPIYNDGTGAILSEGIDLTVEEGQTSAAMFNPFYAQGIAKFQYKVTSSGSSVVKIQASDDCATWTDAVTINGGTGVYQDAAIPSALQTKKYWRIANASSGWFHWIFRAVAAVTDTAHNIVFSTPPAAGAVITCDYVPDCIAKDSDHVFDLTVVITLGEYQE